MVIYETNCHWEDCTKEYDTQEQLVHVSIQAPAASPPRGAALAIRGLCEEGVGRAPGGPPFASGRHDYLPVPYLFLKGELINKYVVQEIF